MNLRYLNLGTFCGAAWINPDGTETQVYSVNTQRNCFANVLYILRSRIEYKMPIPSVRYTIKLYSDPRVVANKRLSNYCPFSKKEILYHLQLVKEVLPEITEYSLSSLPDNDFSGYMVTLVLAPTNNLNVHKYALTWVRYLYEGAFPWIMLDTLRLSKLPEFRFVAISNIINVVTSCWNGNPNIGFNHAIGCGNNEKFLTKKELSAKIHSSRSVNGIYPWRGNLKVSHIPYIEEANTTEYWESEENFRTDRLPVYLEGFKVMKQGYKYSH